MTHDAHVGGEAGYVDVGGKKLALHSVAEAASAAAEWQLSLYFCRAAPTACASIHG